MLWPFGALQLLRVFENHILWTVCRFSVRQNDENDRLGWVNWSTKESTGFFELRPVAFE